MDNGVIKMDTLTGRNGPLHEPEHDQYDINICGTHIALVLVDIDDTSGYFKNRGHLSQKEMRNLSDNVAEYFRRLMPQTYHFSCFSWAFLGIALGFDIEDEPQAVNSIEASAHTVLAQLKNDISLNVNIAISGAAQNRGNIYELLIQTQELMRHIQFLSGGAKIVTAKSLQTGLLPSGIAAKKDLEMQWSSYILDADFENALSVLEQIIDLRASSPDTSSSIKAELTYRLCHMVFILGDNAGGNFYVSRRLLQVVDLVNAAKSVDDLKRITRDVFYEITSVYGGGKVNRTNTLYAAQIAAYIKNNYTNTELNATLISERFGLTTSYISRIFKKSMGIKMIDYIHITRIESIKNLLLNTNLSLNEIAGRSGYKDAYALGRAFSRYVGMPPSQFRR